MRLTDNLVQGILVLVDVVAVSDMRVKVIIQLVLLGFGKSSVGCREIDLQSTGECKVVPLEGVLMRGEKLESFVEIATSEQEVHLGPEVDPIDHLCQGRVKIVFALHVWGSPLAYWRLWSPDCA